jgi:hypothetical protein
MILPVPLENAAATIVIDPFLKNGKDGKIGEGGDEVQRIMEEGRRKWNEPNQAEDKRINRDTEGEDKTAFWSNGVNMTDVEKPTG